MPPASHFLRTALRAYNSTVQQEARTLTKALRSVLPIVFTRTRYCRLPFCQSVSPGPLL